MPSIGNQRTWNTKCFVIPATIGATGIVTTNLRQYLETISGKHPTDSVQKAAVLGTSHIIRKVLQSETWRLSGGVHHWFKGRSPRGKESGCGGGGSDDNLSSVCRVTGLSIILRTLSTSIHKINKFSELWVESSEVILDKNNLLLHNDKNTHTRSSYIIHSYLSSSRWKADIIGFL
jgi:hypothetical protein